MSTQIGSASSSPHRGRAGRRVDAEHLQSCAGRGSARRACAPCAVPAAVTRYWNAARSHVDLDRSPSRPTTTSRTSALGVPGGRVGVLDRLGRGVGRVGDVPALDRGLVDAGDEQPVAVRRPPEAAVAVHLLGGDELGQPPGHVGAVRLDQRAGRSAVGSIPTTRSAPLARRTRPAAGRVGARVDDRRRRPAARGRRRGRGRRRTAARTARTRRSSPAWSVAYADDARAALAAALAPRALLRRQLLRAAVEQRGRVGDQPLGAGARRRAPRAPRAGSVPDADRRNDTRAPSGDTVNVRGAPRVKRPVRAYWRGKDNCSATTVIQPHPTADGRVGSSGRLVATIRLGSHGSIRPTLTTPRGGCCSSTPIPTTRRSTTARRWRRTSPTVPTSRSSRARAARRARCWSPSSSTSAAEGEDTPRFAPRAGARRRDGRARCHRLPLPRRAGRLRDTGMAYERRARGARETIRPDTFWAADLLECGRPPRAVIREVRPHVLDHLRRDRCVRPP